MDIAKIDENFKIETAIDRPGIQFYNIDSEPFKIHGVFREGGLYRRLPKALAEQVSTGVAKLHSHTAGGRIRFITDSPYVAINVKFGNVCRMSHFTLVCVAGFDMYVREGEREIYSGSFMPPYEMTDSFEGIIEFKNNFYAQPERKMRQITINMPTYSELREVYIGLDGDSVVKAPEPYKNDKPIVYYGHSITQGGCASRPGYVYPSILSRRFNCDFINLGFSGNAKGQRLLAEYIAGLDMSVFIYDYDHNAPDAEFLRNTHEAFFKIVRAAHPTVPIIMLSTTPKLQYLGSNEERVGVIYKTYENAKASGDENVYFINGSTVCDESDGHVGATVEGAHINDIGFVGVANAIGEIMKNLV